MSVHMRPDQTYFLDPDEAARHGVPVAAALHAGLMTREDFRAMLDHCSRCVEATGQSHDETDCAPAWCANRDLIEGLRGLV